MPPWVAAPEGKYGPLPKGSPAKEGSLFKETDTPPKKAKQVTAPNNAKGEGAPADSAESFVQFHGHGPLKAEDIPVYQPVRLVRLKAPQYNGTHGILGEWHHEAPRFEIIVNRDVQFLRPAHLIDTDGEYNPECWRPEAVHSY